MATYLLDTNTFSAIMDQHPQAMAHAALLSSTDEVVICTIVRGEILYGIERMPHGRRRRDVEAKATNLFAQTPCEAIPESAADIYAHIKRDAERKGTPLDENDLWIAATTLTIGAVLVTSDSDFQRVSGLTVEDWTT